jgi:hypothetical protein
VGEVVLIGTLGFIPPRRDWVSCYVFVTERMREMHWHSNADEWSYLEGEARMIVFDATSTARTFDSGTENNGMPREHIYSQLLFLAEIMGYLSLLPINLIA